MAVGTSCLGNTIRVSPVPPGVLVCIDDTECHLLVPTAAITDDSAAVDLEAEVDEKLSRAAQ
jgi:hypothetical protein